MKKADLVNICSICTVLKVSRHFCYNKIILSCDYIIHTCMRITLFQIYGVISFDIKKQYNGLNF